MTMRNLFSSEAMKVLSEYGVTLSAEQQAAYQQEIKRAIAQQYANGYRYSKLHKEKNSTQFPYSVWVLKGNPYLVLPTSSKWKARKDSNAKPKILVELRTGEKKFLKISKDLDGMLEETRGLETLNKYVIGFIHNKKGYVFQPYYGDKNLLALMSENMLSAEQAVRALENIAHELKELHSQNRLHLDIKPQNIMYDINREEAILIDHEKWLTFEQGLRGESKLFRGTEGYFSPDWLNFCMMRGRFQFNASNDMYALCVTAGQVLRYAMVAAEQPREKQLLEKAFSQVMLWQHEHFAKLPAASEMHDFFVKILHQLDELWDITPATPKEPVPATPGFLPQYPKYIATGSPRQAPTPPLVRLTPQFRTGMRPNPQPVPMAQRIHNPMKKI